MQTNRSRILRTTFGGLIMFTVVWSIVGALGCAPTPAPTAPDKVSFRLKWLIYSSFASHFVALDRGLFARENLDVSIQPGGPGVDPIRLVATGADDIGLAGYEQIIIARAKGIPVVAIAEDYVRSGVGLFSLKTSNIKTPKDMIGKKVGIMPGTDKFTLYAALMAKAGVDRSKVVEVPIGTDLLVLFNKTVDVFPGFVTNQPFIAEAKGMPVNTIDPYDYDVRPGGNVYFTSEETLKKKRDVLRRFLRAALEGVLESQKLPDEQVVGIVMKYNAKLDRNAELKIWDATKRILLPHDRASLGAMDPKKWEYTANIFEQYGLVEKRPDLGACYTNDLVREALGAVAQN